MYIRHAGALVLAAGLVSAVPALAQQTGGATADPPITLDAARKVALERVPGGKIQDEELEREAGRLVYSFEISVPGKDGAQEVLVDAHAGGIVSVSPEEEQQDDDDGEQDDAAEHSSGPS